MYKLINLSNTHNIVLRALLKIKQPMVKYLKLTITNILVNYMWV